MKLYLLCHVDTKRKEEKKKRFNSLHVLIAFREMIVNDTQESHE